MNAVFFRTSFRYCLKLWRRKQDWRMKSAALIQALSKKFGQTTDKALSQILGITPQTLSNWRNGGEMQPMQVAGLALIEQPVVWKFGAGLITHPGIPT